MKFTGFTHCRNVMQAAIRIVEEEEVGMKKSNTKKEKEPLWKRRILRDVSSVRKDLSRIEAWFAEDGKRTKKRERLARSKVWAEKERVYIGNGRTETENNCKSHQGKMIWQQDHKISRQQEFRDQPRKICQKP